MQWTLSLYLRQKSEIWETPEKGIVEILWFRKYLQPPTSIHEPANSVNANVDDLFANSVMAPEE